MVARSQMSFQYMVTYRVASMQRLVQPDLPFCLMVATSATLRHWAVSGNWGYSQRSNISSAPRKFDNITRWPGADTGEAESSLWWWLQIGGWKKWYPPAMVAIAHFCPCFAIWMSYLFVVLKNIASGTMFGAGVAQILIRWTHEIPTCTKQLMRAKYKGTLASGSSSSSGEERPADVKHRSMVASSQIGSCGSLAMQMVISLLESSGCFQK